MSNETQVIHEQMLFGKELKIYGTKEEPLFLAKDVAEWIENQNPAQMLRVVEEDEKLIYTMYMSGQKRELWFLTEDGLYEVLMQSRKPIAKQFKKQVKEILKTVRQHGAYITEETLEKALTSPDFLIELATKLKYEKEARKLAEDKIEELQPKASKFDQVVDSGRLLTFEAVAHMTVEYINDTRGFKIILNKSTFPKLLRTMKILTKDRKYLGGGYKNLPRQAYQHLFEVKTSEYGEQTKIKPENVTELMEIVASYLTSQKSLVI